MIVITKGIYLKVKDYLTCLLLAIMTLLFGGSIDAIVSLIHSAESGIASPMGFAVCSSCIIPAPTRVQAAW